jgi:translation elongation factor EF-1alpha
MDDRPLRIVIGNVLKCSSNLLSISAKIETGFVDSGDKLFVMPDAMPATVKSKNSCCHFLYFNDRSVQLQQSRSKRYCMLFRWRSNPNDSFWTV